MINILFSKFNIYLCILIFSSSLGYSKIDLVIIPDNDVVRYKSNHFIPSIINNKNRTSFFWNYFDILDHDFWGIGIDQYAKKEDFKIIEQKFVDSYGKENSQFYLRLGPKQMIWSFNRFDNGQLEFRKLSFQFDENSDKIFGFGDPGEGFFIGFRFQDWDKNGNPYMKAITYNFGGTRETKISNIDFTKNNNYFVRWYRGKIDFLINNSIVASYKDDFSGRLEYQIPDIGLEIMTSNRVSGHLDLQLVKYDRFD